MANEVYIRLVAKDDASAMLKQVDTNLQKLNASGRTASGGLAEASQGMQKMRNEMQSTSTGALDLSGKLDKAISTDLVGNITSMAVGLTGLAIAGTVASKAISAMTEIFKWSSDAAKEEAQSVAKLEALIQSTGGAAGMTTQDMVDLSESMQAVTGVSHGVIQSGELLLTTFTNVGRDAFRPTIEAALNMSAVMGGDLQTSVMQVGKALQDPITGLTALRRVGVMFTDQQKEQITTMVEAGDTAGAQALILQELQREFGGAAAAAKSAGDGAAGYANQMDALGEHIGQLTLPITRVINYTKTLNAEMIDTILLQSGVVKGELPKYMTTTAWQEANATEKLIILNKELDKASGKVDTSSSANQRLAESWEKATVTADTFGKGTLPILAKGLDDVKAAADKYSGSQLNVNTSWADASAKNAEVNSALSVTRVGIEETTKSLTDLNAVQFQGEQASTDYGNGWFYIQQAMLRGIAVAEEATKKFEEQQKAIAKLEGQMESARDQLTKAAKDWSRSVGDDMSSAFEKAGIKGQRLYEVHQAMDKVLGTNMARQDEYNAKMAELVKLWDPKNPKPFQDALEAFRKNFADLSEPLQNAISQINDIDTKLRAIDGTHVSAYVDIYTNMGVGGTGGPTTNPGAGKNLRGKTSTWYASGIDTWVTQPTLFGAGESGPERVTVTPAYRSPWDSPASVTYITNYHIYDEGAQALAMATEQQGRRQRLDASMGE